MNKKYWGFYGFWNQEQLNEQVNDDFDCFDSILSNFKIKNDVFEIYNNNKNEIALSHYTENQQNDSKIIQWMPQQMIEQQKLIKSIPTIENSKKQLSITSNAKGQGYSRETLNLTKFLQNKMYVVIQQMLAYKILNRVEVQSTLAQLQTFKRSNEAKVLEQLLANPIIKNQCLSYFTSSTFIQEVLVSPKMKFSNKLSVIKYSQKMVGKIQTGKLCPAYWKKH